jgi:hypothetical protein
MTRVVTAGQTPQDPIIPQRLEVVLFQSPVPTERVDPVEVALAGGKGSRVQRSTHPAFDKSAVPADDKTVADQLADSDSMSMPVRAVRGAFEVRPQPRRSITGRVLTGPEQAQEPTGLWEVWWTPLPRLSSDGLTEVEPAPDTPDATEPPQPFLLASNLRYIRWTAIQQKTRLNELTSTWTGDLPAYVEVEAQTASGFSVNWMFEIDWGVGPEVAKPSSSPTNPGGAGQDAKAAPTPGAAGGTGK